MGFMDDVRKAAVRAREQAGELVDKHGDKIDRAIDKTGSFVDERTGRKYSDKISKAQNAARSATEKIATRDDTGQTPRSSGTTSPAPGGPTPPAGQAPPPGEPTPPAGQAPPPGGPTPPAGQTPPPGEPTPPTSGQDT